MVTRSNKQTDLVLSVRKNIRLKDYDYSQNGAYFVTICTNDHKNHLGEVSGENITINLTGKTVSTWWYKIPEHFKGVELDEFTVMPNHIHGIIFLQQDYCMGEVTQPAKQVTLGQIIAYLKYQATKEINLLKNTPGEKFWQRGYYDHIIRNDTSLNNIREYIRYNYIKWNQDREYLLNKNL